MKLRCIFYMYVFYFFIFFSDVSTALICARNLACGEWDINVLSTMEPG